MSRASTLYASAYDMNRTHEARFQNGAKRTITVDLNGLLPDDVTVSSVSWDSSCQSVVTLSDAAVATRSFSAALQGVCCGDGFIAATAALSDGSVSMQRIHVSVK